MNLKYLLLGEIIFFFGACFFFFKNILFFGEMCSKRRTLVTPPGQNSVNATRAKQA